MHSIITWPKIGYPICLR